MTLDLLLTWIGFNGALTLFAIVTCGFGAYIVVDDAMEEIDDA